MFWIIVGGLIGYLIDGYFGMFVGGSLSFGVAINFKINTICEYLLDIKSDMSKLNDAVSIIKDNNNYELSNIDSKLSSIESDISKAQYSIESELSDLKSSISSMDKELSRIQSNISRIESCNYAESCYER